MIIKSLEPGDIARWLAEKSVLMVAVREPNEFAVERIQGVLGYPMSAVDPCALPQATGCTIVFQCRSGVRSGKTVAVCEAADVPFDIHMRGGIKAWKLAGLPTIRIDTATGKVCAER